MFSTTPPLRQRRSDIKLLLSHLTQQLAAHYQLPPPQYTPKTIKILENYKWHGNVRELRNFCERTELKNIVRFFS